MKSDDQYQAFYSWLTDSFGNEEGKKVFAAALKAQRFIKCVEQHGDFIGARDQLIGIATDLHGSSQWPAFPSNPPT